jgi:hypothetical protein
MERSPQFSPPSAWDRARTSSRSRRSNSGDA